MVEDRAERVLGYYIEELRRALFSALNSGLQKLFDAREVIGALGHYYYPCGKEIVEDLGRHFTEVLKCSLRAKICFLNDLSKISKVLRKKMIEVYDESSTVLAIGRIMSSEFSRYLDPLLNIVGPLKVYPDLVGSPIPRYEMKRIIEMRSPYRILSFSLEYLVERVEKVASDLESSLGYPTMHLNRITYSSDLYEVAFTDARNIHAPETEFRIETGELSKEEKKVFKELGQLAEMYDFILVSGTLNDTWIQGFSLETPYFVKGLHLHQGEEWFIRTRDGIFQVKTTNVKNPRKPVYILRRFLEVSSKF